MQIFSPQLADMAPLYNALVMNNKLKCNFENNLQYTYTYMNSYPALSHGYGQSVQT